MNKCIVYLKSHRIFDSTNKVIKQFKNKVMKTQKEIKENKQQKAEREMWAELEIKHRYTKYRHAFEKGITPNF